MKNIFIIISLLFVSNISFAQPDKKYETSKKDDHTSQQEIYLVVEEMPSYPGGQKEMYDYMKNNLIYPDEAKKAKIEGSVYITFVVDEEGNITNVESIRGIGYGCDEEAIRLIENMPKWNPGKQKGKPVAVRFRIPIKFSLSNKGKNKKK